MYKADGSPSNENQVVKLTHGTLEWSNYLKYLSGSGLCKIEVVKTLIRKDGELVECDIPDDLVQEVKIAHEGDNTVVLTEEQKKINKLEEQNKAMMEQLEALTKGMKEKAEDVEVVAEDVSELEGLKKAYEEKFGKKPHHLWKKKKLIEKLAE